MRSAHRAPNPGHRRDCHSGGEPLPKESRCRPDLAQRRDCGVLFRSTQSWLNAAPADLLDFGLPDGFAERTIIVDTTL